MSFRDYTILKVAYFEQQIERKAEIREIAFWLQATSMADSKHKAKSPQALYPLPFDEKVQAEEKDYTDIFKKAFLANNPKLRDGRERSISNRH